MSTKIDKSNYYEFAEAIYCFALLHYDGPKSEMFSIMSITPFIPSLRWSQSQCVKENYYYCEIAKTNIVKLNEELLAFMESRES